MIWFVVCSHTGDELRQKWETERNEITRLHQEIAELQQIRDDLYEEEDDSSASSDEDETQDEAQLQAILQTLIKQNHELVVRYHLVGKSCSACFGLPVWAVAR